MHFTINKVVHASVLFHMKLASNFSDNLARMQLLQIVSVGGGSDSMNNCKAQRQHISIMTKIFMISIPTNIEHTRKELKDSIFYRRGKEETKKKSTTTSVTA